MCYMHTGPDAPHRQTLVSHTDFLEALARAMLDPSPIFNIPRLLIIFLALDSTHGGDLGPFADITGSIHWQEASNKQWHRTIGCGFRFLRTRFAEYRRAHEHIDHIRLTS